MTTTIRITVDVTYIEGFEAEDAARHAELSADALAQSVGMSRRVQTATWATEEV